MAVVKKQKHVDFSYGKTVYKDVMKLTKFQKMVAQFCLIGNNPAFTRYPYGNVSY